MQTKYTEIADNYIKICDDYVKTNCDKKLMSLDNTEKNAIEAFAKWLDRTHPLPSYEKIDRIIWSNFLLWGIPAIPAFVVYKTSQPFINTAFDAAIQLIGIVIVYLVILGINYGVYWERYYDKYINEDIYKHNKNKDNKHEKSSINYKEHDDEI